MTRLTLLLRELASAHLLRELASAHLLISLAACNFDMSMGGSTDAPPGQDAAPDDDARIDAPGIDKCIGEGANQVCLVTLPTAPVEYANNVTIDTNVSGTCAATTNAAAADWCVIAGTQISVFSGEIVRVIGAKPIVFASLGDIIVVGTIDVGSRGTTMGAGGNSSACVAGTNATAGNSSGGGYGGSFGGRGGNGETADGGAGGISPLAASSVTALRGGCAGGPGGPLSNTMSGGGAGGGGLALLSRTKITLPGALNASGAGGKVESLVRLGGGGGGSGGMIVLDAPVIDATGANIFANGGGGGEGNDLVFDGVVGTEPLGPAQVGAGGSGMSAGGDGGPGSLGVNGGSPPMNASSSNAGGGGGGGGTGVIMSRIVPLTGANVSPLPVGSPMPMK